MARHPTRRYLIVDIPVGKYQGLEILADALMTAEELAESCQIPKALIQKRLTSRGWRSWAQLTQSPEAARLSARAESRKYLRAAWQCDRQSEIQKVTTQIRMERGHKVL